jgi:prepilin-type N-terminal cleavage/methylation domain-containing protein
MPKIKKILKKIIERENGTTLVEMLVAISLFSIFITVAIGGFIQSLSNQRLVLKLMEATDNLSLTIEQMSREIRVGGEFQLIDDGKGIQFIKADEQNGISVKRQVSYVWDQEGKSIKRTTSLVDNIGNITDTIDEEITAGNVQITYFFVDLLRKHEPGPTKVNIRLGVSSIDKGRSITNYVQTSISSKLF